MTSAEFLFLVQAAKTSTEPIFPDDLQTAIRVAIAAGEIVFALQLLAAFDEQEASIAAFHLNQAQANPGANNSH